DKLQYYVPNRLTESHGLNNQGLEQLKIWGASLIVTCDTGSTNLAEIAYAKALGVDIIVTDHHTLPEVRPDVVAIINPRYFAATHPLYHLSGVAVAYKLVEALYETLPDIPQQPLTNLLDLVAIGLIADLVALKGDCRYLAQRGIQQLKKQLSPRTVVHPGIKALLENCRKTGDRPTDISFGLGPRINAVSRIYGDADFCVELLTSRDPRRCGYLAQQTEVANTRRKELQKTLSRQAEAEAEKLDLSTTGVLVLCHPQWQGGILGLVANQIAQTFGRPTILLTYDRDQNLWKGSARSVQGLDLYDLVKDQAHLLHRFGGHPFAAGLSIRPENLDLFRTAINQQARQRLGPQLSQGRGMVTVDLEVRIRELGEKLFRELEYLEPCGMGNPKPRFLVKDCGLDVLSTRKLQDRLNRQVNYWKTEFLLWDETGDIEGIFWGRPEDLQQGPGLDAVVELDYSRFQDTDEYVVHLIALAPTTGIMQSPQSQRLVDLRRQSQRLGETQNYLLYRDCPTTWQELYQPYQEAITLGKPLALNYGCPKPASPEELFKTLIGLGKYCLGDGQSIEFVRLKEKLGCGDRPLHLGLAALKNVGLTAEVQGKLVHFQGIPRVYQPETWTQFKAAILEEQFQRQYFITVPLEVIQRTLDTLVA
ncbi:MAG: single-stranded-DNA-specific exonuclease RecJ, partial [Synechococcus sp.]|nr:single-stranded-DNA-specific exonuclease RecJ [Synechococcus sp.]